MLKKFNNLLKKNKKDQDQSLDAKFVAKLRNGDEFNEKKLKDYTKEELIICFKQYIAELHKVNEIITQ